MTSILLVEKYELVGGHPTASRSRTENGRVRRCLDAGRGNRGHVGSGPGHSRPAPAGRQRAGGCCPTALTRLDSPTYVHLALAGGDNGYVLKSASPAELLDAVRRLARGEEYVQPTLGRIGQMGQDPPPPRSGLPVGTTRREEEVLQLLALGHTNAEAAAALGVGLRTVEAHRTHVMAKLGLPRGPTWRFVTERLS